MHKPALCSLLCAVLMTGTWTATTRESKALNPDVAADSSIEVPGKGLGHRHHRGQVAQLFFPPAGQRSVLRVVGKGEARQSADVAHIELEISEGSDGTAEFPDEPSPFQGGSGTKVSLTKKDLRPIVDALLQSGIPQMDIMVKITQPRSTGLPLPIPPIGSAGKAAVEVQLQQPTQEGIEAVVTTANKAADKLGTLVLDNVTVHYQVKDCAQLAAKAYAIAVQDARNRAQAIAQALDAKLSPVPSVAEPFYGVFLPGCNEELQLPFVSEGIGDELDDLEVEVKRDIFVTYTVK